MAATEVEITFVVSAVKSFWNYSKIILELQSYDSMKIISIQCQVLSWHEWMSKEKCLIIWQHVCLIMSYIVAVCISIMDAFLM